MQEVLSCGTESLERRADTAFGKRRSEEEYQQRTKARSLGKVTRRLWTDSTKDYMLRHTELSDNARNWMYKSVKDKLYKLLFQKNAKQLRQLLSCSNPRDSLSARDLQEVERIEALATKLIDGMDMHPVTAIENAFRLQMMVSKEPDIFTT